VLTAAGVAWTASGATLAEVATDGTLGRKVKLTGRDVEVGADLGRVRGKNLFHSFERFGVPTRGKVTLTGPGGLDNVISRVTGGEPSSIDGTLASRVPGADVYLVNPSGIVFGPNARLDVPGSFHASTADEVRFEGGVAFSANDPGRGGLSVARPEAFGFLGGGRPAGIQVNESVLQVPTGEVLSVVGGDVTVVGGPEGFIEAEAGRVTIGALAGAGTVRVDTGERAGAGAGIRLTDRALVDVSGDGGGAVRIRGGQVVVEDFSAVRADNTGATAARGGVTIEAEEVTVASGSRVAAAVLAKGRGGDIAVVANRVQVDSRDIDTGDMTVIGSEARAGSEGATGAVTVEAREVELLGGAIGSVTSAQGDAGTVRVVATERLFIEGDDKPGFVGPNTGITAQTNPFSSGDAGKVTVIAGDLEIRNGGGVSSTTFGSGDAGAVVVKARSLLMDNDGATFATGISSGTDFKVFDIGNGTLVRINSTGDAGSVKVTVDEDLRIFNGASIASAVRGPGDGGEVEVKADRVLISRGKAPFFTGITTSTEFQGSAGKIDVEADQIEIRDSGEVSSSAFGTGPAGDVSIEGRGLLVEDAFVFTIGAGAEGGRINVGMDDVIVLDGAVVTSSGIQPEGGASVITLRAPQVALLDGSRVTSFTGDGAPLTGSGEARVLGDLTFISDDSVVAGSSTVELAGVDNTVGTGLQISPGAFLDAGALLGQTCAARRSGRASSFTRAGGGLPPRPTGRWRRGTRRSQGRAASAEGRRLLVAGSGALRRVRRPAARGSDVAPPTAA
jgi:filamentous hemagglutinin family protein